MASDPHSARPTTARIDHVRAELPSAPLGPDSLTWRYFGDVRHLLLTGRAGVLQTMHPAISQALVDHSDYFDDPIDRISRSSGPILGVVYDEAPADTGRSVRDWHQPIRSSEPSEAGPQGYRALDPEVFYWAHATFFESIIVGKALFGTPFTLDEQRQLFAEHVTWYRRYGMSMAPVPASLEEFFAYWDRMHDEVLQATTVAAGALRRTKLPQAPLGIPGPAWTLTEPGFAYAAAWVTSGALSPKARAILGASWTPADHVAYAAVVRGIRAAWPLVPERHRLMTRARAGYERARREGEAAASGHAVAA